MIAVAVAAVAITGLVSLQLVRSSLAEDARSQLASQADFLAESPRLLADRAAAQSPSINAGGGAPAGTEVAIVRADGTAEGAAASYVDPFLLKRTQRDGAVSTVRPGVVIETRRLAAGDTLVLVLPTDSINLALGRATTRILIALGVGVLVAAIGGAILARVLSRPLTETAAAARRLASGERGVPLPRPTTREVADVADALGGLDAALAASEGRQREFLVSISHELRTPLTAMRGYAEAMSDGLVGADQVRSVGSTLVEETKRLDQFVADLLELSRLEADDFSIHLQEVDIQRLFAEVVQAWRGRADLMGITVTATGSGVVNTDPQRLRQVVDGLVENAMRVSPVGSVVEVRAPTVGLIEITDQGPGLSDEDLEVVFRRGALRARYRNERPVGTGLGLSIAARLVQRLGGTITAANRAEGGALFAVRLP